MCPKDEDLTLLLQRAAEDPVAGAAVLPRVYEELRRLAGGAMVGERRSLTLQPTALVHEAWLKLVGDDGEPLAWDGRAHFFGAAAIAMRRILVDRARRVASEKHGGLMQRQSLADLEQHVDAPLDADAFDFEALDAALDRLARQDERAARIVELRFFAGLTVEDTARALGVSERTVAREWNVARVWLARELERHG
ncbi:MAG: ECF-type sigma factor [Planctomycetota bacterium]